MATPNTLSGPYPHAPHISKTNLHIAGITLDVYGLSELSPFARTISVLWLLHPRLSKRAAMAPIASATILAWNAKVHASFASQSTRERGLIAIAFDQRNHGSRLVSKLANAAWTDGNPTHAQDMFSIFQGTAADVSQLISYLPAYLFQGENRTIVSNMVLGISLGGHAAWHCLLHDERIRTAVVVIGCADYARLMAHRAEASKLESWTATTPRGKSFKGSKDLPPALVQAIDKYDPAGLLLGEMAETGSDRILDAPPADEVKRLTPLMRDHVEGKRIFNLAGGDDKLVPHSCSKPFLQWLQKATSPGGWYAGHDVHIKDKVYPGVGHAFSSDMMKDAVVYITDAIAREVKDPVARI